MTKAIMLMFDSLNRHMLPPYSAAIDAPNFGRLAQRSVTFDNAYAGSMPCIPARRELHTGRYNFLHRSWGPLEPFDDSAPELLGRAGIHTHLASDHPHYWEDGGATYHTRFTTWEHFRGQEGDPWKGHVAATDPRLGASARMRSQDAVNQLYYTDEAQHPQTRTIDAGIDFIRTNADADNWMVQIECFDPHEPFITYQQYRDRYNIEPGQGLEWPSYAKVTQDQGAVDATRKLYSALVSMCDRSLGRVLDSMDELDLWDDTLLIVNTDHGYLLGEHGWWAKSMMPWFNELVHIPLFIWDPRHRGRDKHCSALVQTIDLAPTLLGYFGVEQPDDMQGIDLHDTVNLGVPSRASALFGMHGGHVNITDGRYVYMRAPILASNTPLEELTLMPTHMRGRFTPEELTTATLSPPLPFTKGAPVLRTTATGAMSNPYLHGTLLFDLEHDPDQLQPIIDDNIELHMLSQLRDLMIANDAPDSQFQRLGIPQSGELGHEHLLAGQQRLIAEQARQPLPPAEALPRGERWSITSPIPELLNHPPAAELLRQHVPDLLRVEIVNATPGMTLYQLAAHIPISPDSLHDLAEALSNL